MTVKELIEKLSEYHDDTEVRMNAAGFRTSSEAILGRRITEINYQSPGTSEPDYVELL